MEGVLKEWDRVDHSEFCSMIYHTWPHDFIGMGGYIHSYLQDGYFVFTTVRNPYDRYMSGLAHHKRQRVRVDAYWFHEHVLATQKETLGGLVPDYLMRLENIENDYQYIKNRFGLVDLPKLNGTEKGEITEPMVEWVNEHFAEDFKLLGYERR